MAYQPIVLGSNLIPDGALGALPGGPYSIPDEERGEVVTNEDGTVTVPTYTVESNVPTFDLEEMQNIYGTKYMPMFRWISQKQTGSVTFDPDEGQISDEEAERLSADFENETGMSAAEALKAQQKEMMKALGKETALEVAKGIGGQIGYATAANDSIYKGAEAYFDIDSPFELVGKKRADGTTDLLRNSTSKGVPTTKLGALSSVDPKNRSALKSAFKSGGVGNEDLQKRITELNANAAELRSDGYKGSASKLDAQAQELKDLAGNTDLTGGTSVWAGVKDRGDLGFGGDGKMSAAGKSNLYGSAGAGLATFAAAMVSGESARDAAKRGLGVTVGTFVGNLLPVGPLGGFLGGMIGGALGGRVICNELMRQGIMTRKQVILDYKFTEDYLTPQHVAGYHVWAVWMVRQMRKGRLVNFWTHVAGHRANEIAYIYGDRDKPDYLGKVYRKILEPICWSIGFFCQKTDWTVLYKEKEI